MSTLAVAVVAATFVVAFLAVRNFRARHRLHRARFRLVDRPGARRYGPNGLMADFR